MFLLPKPQCTRLSSSNVTVGLQAFVFPENNYFSSFLQDPGDWRLLPKIKAFRNPSQSVFSLA